MKLQGIFPPIATPFDHEGNIYASKVRHNVEKWNRTTLAGYVVCGSTGESVMLTGEEKVQLWELVASCAAAEKLLIAGTGVNIGIDLVTHARTFTVLPLLPITAWLLLLYLALVCTVLGYGLWYLVIRQTDTVPVILAACAVFGFSVGNLITLPPLIIHREFSAASFVVVMGLSTAISGTVGALGPGLIGVIRGWSSDYDAALLVCIVLQLVAAAIVARPGFLIWQATPGERG